MEFWSIGESSVLCKDGGNKRATALRVTILIFTDLLEHFCFAGYAF